MFKRKPREQSELDQDESVELEAQQDEEPQAARPEGPFDAAELDLDDHYVDFGAILVRPTPGLEARLERLPNSTAIVALTLVQSGAAVRLRVLAAPRSGGSWSKHQDEIVEQITKEGGRADQVPGPWGTEVSAAVIVRNEQGGVAGMQGLRFVGVEGPRWLLQATFMGDGADPGKAAGIEALFRSLVVVRGDEAMPVGVQLTLREPSDAGAELPLEPVAPSLDLLQPGARITEIR